MFVKNHISMKKKAFRYTTNLVAYAMKTHWLIMIGVCNIKLNGIA